MTQKNRVNKANSHEGNQEFFLPKLESLSIDLETTMGKVFPFSFVFTEEFKEFFERNKNDLAKLGNELIKLGQGKDFRVQRYFKNVPFLFTLFYQDREIKILTPKASNELFLMGLLTKDRKSKFSEDEKENYLLFKSHLEKVVSLSSSSFPSIYKQVCRKEDLVDLLEENNPYAAAEEKMNSLMEQLADSIKLYKPSLFEKFSDYGLGLTANYALIRVHLLKFLAILPNLDHDSKGKEVKRILLESLRRLLHDSNQAKNLKLKGESRALPSLIYLLTRWSHFGFSLIPSRLLAYGVRNSVKIMAKRFIAGESIDKAHGTLSQLQSTGREATLDQLGELVVSNKEADNYEEKVLELIRGLELHYTKGAKNPAGIYKAHVSIKVSALCNDFRPEALDYCFEQVYPRLKRILIAAKEYKVFLNIDAEHYHYRDLVFEIYKKTLLQTPELTDFDQTGIVLQAYLRDAAQHLDQIIHLAKERKLSMPIRLVKGAYWDAETIEAEVHSHDAPEFINKEETDLHFRSLLIKILRNYPHTVLTVASHNIGDHCFAEALREDFFVEHPPIEHQCLHMTYEGLSHGLARQGWVTRNYMPIGSLLVGMAYLVRRIMENSSQVGVLTIMRSHKKLDRLLSPRQVFLKNQKKSKLKKDLTIELLSSNFYNVSPVLTYLPSELDEIDKARVEVSKTFPRKYENKFLAEGEPYEVNCPSDPKFKIGQINFAGLKDAERAISTINKDFSSGNWSTLNFRKRISILLKAANIMLLKRNDLAALIIYESGKTLTEALADVDEAIDFINFYCREESTLMNGERELMARGPMAVIAPWNFPLAIPCGMTVASLIAGNPTILKSAEQTPLIAQELVDILHLAGVPEKSLIHLPGWGEEVGEALVKSPLISGIVFTGSKAVGLHILKQKGKQVYKHPLDKIDRPAKVITEMGGKNAIIVTANAELDETVSGILYSAFAHGGQKCSAASRIIVHHSVKDKLTERLIEAMRDIKVGPSWEYSTFLNTVISRSEKERLLEATGKAKEEAVLEGGKVHLDKSSDYNLGHCVGPVLIEVPYERALQKESYSQREHFGPLIHIVEYQNLNEAVTIFNSTEYALTGGVFSQSQDDIDFLQSRLDAGNLYINRSCTGARVSIEPFGGFKMSGTGPKAGGKDYLQSFHVQRISHWQNLPSENISSGSDYKFDLATNSKLSLSGRVKRLNHLLIGLLHQYDSLFQGVYENDKEVVRQFRAWVNNEFLNFIEGKHENRKIPGQLSFNDLTRLRNPLIVILRESYPSLEVVLSILTAMLVGRGVTLICEAQPVYQRSMGLLDLCRSHGFSSQNIECGYPSDSLFKEILLDPCLGGILCDGRGEQLNRVFQIVFDEGNFEGEELKQILVPFECPAPSDYSGYLKLHIHPRSFAINTMRHGAPLNLEFE